MENKILKIGMPAGSLANPKRGGNLIELLEKSGFATKGYENGGPSSFSTINFLFGWDGRPQEFGAQLGLEELDVAIAGDDWIKERQLELEKEYKKKIVLEKMLPLRRGGVQIVGIIHPKHKVDNIQQFLKGIADQDIITIVSEMPYIALEWIQGHLKALGLLEKFPKYSVQKYKTPSKIKKGIVIYETWGKTEAKIKNEGADLGLEITQTGSAIRNYGLTIIDLIMESETGIWINPKIKKDAEKKDLLDMFLINLYGTVNAEDKVMIIFNVANMNRNEVEKYLEANYLYADEPTRNEGESFTEYSIQVDIVETKLPLAKIRYELAKRKAININTIPIKSSIVSLDNMYGRAEKS